LFSSQTTGCVVAITRIPTRRLRCFRAEGT
jgi:hypothetical protein